MLNSQAVIFLRRTQSIKPTSESSSTVEGSGMAMNSIVTLEKSIPLFVFTGYVR